MNLRKLQKNPHIIVWQSGSMKITTYLLWFPLCVHRVHHLIVHRIPFNNFLILHTFQHMCNRNRNQEQAHTTCTCTMYNICSYSNSYILPFSHLFFCKLIIISGTTKGIANEHKITPRRRKV